MRPEYSEATPEFGLARTLRGIRLVLVADLVRMKLTRFRLKDQVHLKDLDEVGLITAEIEGHLSPLLRERLVDVRSRE